MSAHGGQEEYRKIGFRVETKESEGLLVIDFPKSPKSEEYADFRSRNVLISSVDENSLQLRVSAPTTYVALKQLAEMIIDKLAVEPVAS